MNHRIGRDIQFQSFIEYRNRGIGDRQHGNLPVMIAQILDEFYGTLHPRPSYRRKQVADEQNPLLPALGSIGADGVVDDHVHLDSPTNLPECMLSAIVPTTVRAHR